jgi:hypothetical protein
LDRNLYEGALWGIPASHYYGLLRYLPGIFWIVPIILFGFALHRKALWRWFATSLMGVLFLYLLPAIHLVQSWQDPEDMSGQWGLGPTVGETILFPIYPFILPGFMADDVERLHNLEYEESIAMGIVGIDEVLSETQQLSIWEIRGISRQLDHGAGIVDSTTLRSLLLNIKWEEELGKTWGPVPGLLEKALLNPANEPETLEAFFHRYPTAPCVAHLVANPKTPMEVLEAMVKSPEESVRHAALNSGRFSHEQIRAWIPGLMEGTPRDRNFVASYPRVSESLLEILADDPDPWVRAGVAGNPRTPYRVLEKIARTAAYGDFMVWDTLSDNPNIPHATIHRIRMKRQSEGWQN